MGVAYKLQCAPGGRVFTVVPHAVRLQIAAAATFPGLLCEGKRAKLCNKLIKKTHMRMHDAPNYALCTITSGVGAGGSPRAPTPSGG